MTLLLHKEIDRLKKMLLSLMAVVEENLNKAVLSLENRDLSRIRYIFLYHSWGSGYNGWCWRHISQNSLRRIGGKNCRDRYSTVVIHSWIDIIFTLVSKWILTK